MGRTVLITGCSSGFGRAAALAFHRAGWNVVATMRDTTRWSGADLPEDILVVPLDVQDAEAIQVALAKAVSRFGRLDCLVNNAGQGLFSVFEVTPMTAIRALFETNTFGVMQLTQAILPHFRENGGGCVVNVTSQAAITPEPLMAAYNASKWAVEGLTECLHYELEPQGIAVKLVEPGFVPTTNIIQQILERSKAVPVPSAYQAFVDQTMAMYMGEPSYELGTEADVAQAIVAAASDGGGRLRYVVGGDAKAAAHMRRETSEDEYIAWARSRFGAKA